MENTCINLPSVFQQLTSLILHWSEQTELSKQRYLSFHLKAYNIEGKDICFCNLKVSTNCKLPLIDLLKDGQLDRLAQLVLDVQCGSDDNFALVCTVVDDSCHGTTVTTSTCIRLNRDNTSILNVLAKQKDGVAEEGSNLPGTHLHVKFHRNKYTLLLEGKTIYDFLYKLKFFHPNMKLSFMLSLDGQMSKASYGFQNSTWVGRFQVVSDPKYYITSAPATAKIIFGMGEKLDERNCFQVECLVCHVLGKSAMKAHGSASMYGPNQVPMIVEYEDWANVEPLTVVDWKAFGFLAYVDDAKLTGRSASVLRLSVADPTLLPPWATNHRFELRFSYVIRCLAVDVKDETDISLWMKKMCTENPSHLQTATTAALTALYCTPSDVNNEVKSELEKFLPIITESLAEMYTRSGNIDFRQTLESAFQIHNGLSLEAVMRRSLQGLLAVEKDLCGAASQTVASQPPSSTIDNWECCYMQATNVTALDSLTNIRATDVTALDHSSSEYPPLSEEDERWFTQMEQELAN